MCGIIGYSDSDITALKKAHALQCHRGPDDSGFYTDDHIALGHNRLSIIDLDSRSAQPLWNTHKNLAIVFNGEIYNYKELREQLTAEYNFQTESDTEVLLALYQKYGHQLTEHIHGMYAFAIYDADKSEVALFRDEFGIKPLYHAFLDGKLFFTSELKAMVSLFASYQLPLELDNDSISVYLTLGYTISPHTMYRDIKLLLPGTGLRYNLKESSAPEFFTAQLPIAKNLSESEYMDVIEKKILSNLVADVPVGVFFSGGTDSSLIAAVLHKHNIDLETFSVKVEGRDADEYYFKKIAEQLKLKNTTYTFNTEAFDDIYDEVMNKLDNPSGSTSIFQTYFIAKKASEKVKVVLMGDGGDELFLGYPRSFPLFTMPKENLQKGAWLDRLYFLLPSFYAKNLLFLKISEFFNYPLSYYFNQMSITRDRGSFSAWQICRKQILERNISPNELDLKLYLSEGLLFKNDAATSYCSIEGRVPFLDTDIYSDSKTYSELSMKKKESKYILKTLLAKFLTKDVVYRKKSGFGISYKTLAENSQKLKRDLPEMIATLKKHNIVLPRHSSNIQVAYPEHTIQLATLAKSLNNNNVIYQNHFSSK